MRRTSADPVTLRAELTSRECTPKLEPGAPGRPKEDASMKPTLRISQLLHSDAEAARRFCEQVQSFLTPIPPFDLILRALEQRPDLANDPQRLAAHVASLVPSLRHSERPRTAKKKALSVERPPWLVMRTKTERVVPRSKKLRPRWAVERQAGYAPPAAPPKPEKNIVAHHGTEKRHKHSPSELPVCRHGVPLTTACHLCRPSKYSPLDN